MRRLTRYTHEARQALTYARQEARRLRHKHVGPEHLFLGLLKLHDPLIESLFMALHVNIDQLFQSVEFVLGSGIIDVASDPILNAAARAALERAEKEALAEQLDFTDVEHLLFGILTAHHSLSLSVIESFGLTLIAIREQIAQLKCSDRSHLILTAHYQSRYGATPTLNTCSRDLTMMALHGLLDPCIGRETELEQIMQVLSRRTKNNPALLGPAGVGKTALVEGLAQRIIEGNVPEPLQHARVVALDIAMLTTGTRFRGEFEERLQRILHEITTAKDVIVVLDELHLLTGTGVAAGSIDAANLFKPLLARGDFRCIGTTTPDNYRNSIETDPALKRRFQPIYVHEPSSQETLAILRGLRERYASFYRVTISDEALVAAVQLSEQHVNGRYLPDKAIDLLDEAAARKRVQYSSYPANIYSSQEQLIIARRQKEQAIARHHFPDAARQRALEHQLMRQLEQEKLQWQAHIQSQQSQPILHAEDIIAVVTARTDIPVASAYASTEKRQFLLRLEEQLRQRIIGQDEAIQAVARAVRRAYSPVRERRRPIGSFLFVGPGGVGKSELARALAATLLHDEHALLQLDMSEFMELHHVVRLIGSPPGYVGHEQGGQLTEAVRRQPYRIILFDEIEKAHPQVLDLLLQILEDGCLTDARGQIVDFRHTIIILTSNVGSVTLQQQPMAFYHHQHYTQSWQHYRTIFTEAVKSAFKPELLNRIDEIVIFQPLEREQLRAIVDLLVEQTQQRMQARSITLTVNASARQLLVERGYDRLNGARTLRRTVQHLLDDMLAEAILCGDLCPAQSVTVSAEGQQLNLSINTENALKKAISF
jgi:ATP-dependent Clp protease ATP-binding subunit ClpC